MMDPDGKYKRHIKEINKCHSAVQSLRIMGTVNGTYKISSLVYIMARKNQERKNT